MLEAHTGQKPPDIRSSHPEEEECNADRVHLRIDRLEDQVNERLSGMSEAFAEEIASLRVFILQGGAWAIGGVGVVMLSMAAWVWDSRNEEAVTHRDMAILLERTSVQLSYVAKSVENIRMDEKEESKERKAESKEHVRDFH